MLAGGRDNTSPQDRLALFSEFFLCLSKEVGSSTLSGGNYPLGLGGFGWMRRERIATKV